MKLKLLAVIVGHALQGREIHVDGITNEYGVVSRKDMSDCFAVMDFADDGQLKAACKELQIPFAPYRCGWGGPKQKMYPILKGIVVRVDHAEKVREYLKGRTEKQLELPKCTHSKPSTQWQRRCITRS